MIENFDDDLDGLVDQLWSRELAMLSAVFEIIGALQYAERAAGWARWWAWRARKALGEHAPEPQRVSLHCLWDSELAALRQEFEAIGENHRDDEGLLQFVCGVAAAMDFTLYEREAARPD